MPGKKIGSFTFVLHAHLPYVLSHGRWPHGTDWLNEAAAETYIPILNVLTRLVDEGISPRLTLGITPVLTEQLASPVFGDEFRSYLDNKVEAAKADIKELKAIKEPQMAKVARMWEEFYTSVRDDFTGKYGEDIVGAFSRLQKKGHIEIITCGATHGYFPLLSRDESIQAQVKQAIASYRRHYGRKPKGIWLPECAYRPGYRWSPPVEGGGIKSYERKGVEEFLSENGIEFFVVDSHLLEGGKAIGVYLDRFEALGKLWGQFSETYKPRAIDPTKSPYDIFAVGKKKGKKPVSILTRDPETGIQVWSGEHGYPGNPHYLDFHKKRFPGGLRYWSVTDIKADLAEKKQYRPEAAQKYIPEQAYHFKELVKETLLGHLKKTGRQGLLTAPYDAELLGHWWFEGPQWLYHVLKNIAQDGELELTTGSRYLSEHRERTLISLPEGSWGEGGFHYIWLNEWTNWTWKHVYECEAEMVSLAKEFSHKDDPQLGDILKQAARELLLMQSSDWQFLISTWSARDYAEMRFTEH
ncbi:MAG TPA: 1,4-alpha-glucan branching protein domain-containing protein, partial [Nitrospirota bacterium]|nr:1,4-alpha-glucan branching protein domain-containing protein [Nitrospirota bacterium]